jgi:hypothetical protein
MEGGRKGSGLNTDGITVPSIKAKIETKKL